MSSGAQAAASAAPQRYRDHLERSLRHNGAQAMRILESRKYLGSSGVKGWLSLSETCRPLVSQCRHLHIPAMTSANVTKCVRNAGSAHRTSIWRRSKMCTSWYARAVGPLQPLTSRVRAGAKMVVGQAAEWVERYSAAAAGLVVAASFWSVAHPPSYHLLRCIAAALPVWAGYTETARACASGRVPDGPPVSTNFLSFSSQSVRQSVDSAFCSRLGLIRCLTPIFGRTHVSAALSQGRKVKFSDQPVIPHALADQRAWLLPAA